MFRLLNKTSSRAEILIYGDIGPKFWGEEVSGADFVKLLRDVGSVAELDIRINSYGGDVFEGLSIYRHLADHPAKVTVHIDGIAASIASVIAMAGDTIKIAEAARVMVHDAWTVAIGDAAEMLKTAERLESTSKSLAEIYAARTGRTAEEFRSAMLAETWYTGREAVEAGLADHLVENKASPEASLQGAPIVDPAKHKFKNLPHQLAPGRQAAAGLVAKQLVAISLSTAAARKRA